MGIRIQKMIGYFLKASDCKKLLIPNYSDIIYDILFGEHDNFFSELLLNRLLGSPLNSDLIDPFEHSLFVSFLPKKSANDIIHSLMTNIYMCDDFKGILFQTPALHAENRHDTCLDYYDKPFKFECKYINRGIYPYDGFRTKHPITILDDQYHSHQRISIQEIKTNLFVQLSQKETSKEAIIKLMNNPTQLMKAIKAANNYYPEVASEVKWLIQQLELNKENISTLDIITHLQPAIITTWG